MTTALLPTPEWQLFDRDGRVLSGGLVSTYIPDTTTPKATWADVDQLTQHTNPIVLSADGRATVFGSGRYRLIITDALGNLLIDGLSEAPLGDSAISPVMLAVTQASTLAEARRLMGIDDFVQQSVHNIELLPGPTGPQGIQGIQGPTGPAGAQGPAGAAGASAGGAAEAYTVHQSLTQVSITSSSGVCKWDFTGDAGGGGMGPGSWEVLRDGNRIWVGGPQAVLSPPGSNTPLWDHCGAGTHIYGLHFFIDAQTLASYAVAGIPPDWDRDFSASAWAYFTVISL